MQIITINSLYLEYLVVAFKVFRLQAMYRIIMKLHLHNFDWGYCRGCDLFITQEIKMCDTN